MDNITLEMIFEQSNRILVELRVVRDDIQQIKLRLSSIESAIVGMRTDIAHQWVVIDQHAARLERLEKRTNLID
jgi:hypothetical protein